MSLRIVEWDGTREVVLTPVEWDGTIATVLHLGMQGYDPTPPDEGSLFTATVRYPSFTAHRGGDPGPQQTLYAYRASYDAAPWSWAEADMRVLADGKTVVLHHDQTIDNLVAPESPIQSGVVAQMTPAQWSQLLFRPDWGGGDPQPAAFLSDLLTEYGPNSGKPRLLMLEIKRQVTNPMVCIQQILDAGVADRTIINSFELSYMQLAVQHGLEAMHDTNEPDFPALAASGIRHVCVERSYVTEEMCLDAVRYGVRLWTYLVNNVGVRDPLLDMGVSGMHSNAPATVGYPPTLDVDVDFEDGTLGDAWTFTQGAVATTDAARTGTYGARVAPDQDGYACLTIGSSGFPTGHKWVSGSFWFRLQDAPDPEDPYVNLAEVANTVSTSPKSQFTLYFNKGDLYADFNTGDQTKISDPPALGEWHHIEWRAFYGDTTYRARVRFDDGDCINLISANDKEPSTANALWIRYPSTVSTYTADYDDIKLVTADCDPGWLT